MNDHLKRELVDSLTRIAKEFAGTQQLRARLADAVLAGVDGIVAAELERVAHEFDRRDKPAQFVRSLAPGAIRTYTAKLKTRRQMERDIPRNDWGWWIDVCPGETLTNLRDATEEDIARCNLREGQSTNPADYLCESFERGALVSRVAVATLTLNGAT